MFHHLTKAVAFLFVIISLLVSSEARSETHGHAGIGRLFTTVDGLSSSIVHCLVQDADGFIWIGTSYGLCRYDGHSFRTFHVKIDETDGTACDIVSALAPLDRHRLFVGTFDGVFVFDCLKGSFVPVRPGKGMNDLRRNPVYGSVPLGDGRVLYHAGSLGWLVVGTDGVATLWEHQPSIRPTCLAQLGNQQLYVGCDYGLYRYDFSSRALSAVPFTSHLKISSLEFTRGGDLLVGTDGMGLYRFSPSFSHLVRLPYEGKQFAVLEDFDGALWLGLMQRGLYYASARSAPFSLISAGGGLLGESCAVSLLRDSNNTLWVGTDGDGLYAIKPGAVSSRHYAPGAGGMAAAILAIAQAPDGQVYVGSYLNGAARLDTVTGTTYPLACTSSKESSHVFSMVADKRGRLWIATLGDGLKCYDPSTGRVEQWKSASADASRRLPSDYCVDLALDEKHGRLWVAMARGLACVDLSSGKLINTPRGTHDIVCNTLTLGPRGEVLLGTSEGIVVLTDTVSRYTGRDGLPCDNVYALGFDHDNRLWVATDEGLSMLSMKGDSLSSGLVLNRKTLNGQEFSLRAITSLADGRMAIAGTMGVTVIDPTLLHSGGRLRRPVLTQILAGGEPFPFTPTDTLLSFPNNRRSITLAVSSMAYGMGSGVSYRYSIDGQPWQVFPGGSAELSLPMLAPGNYRLDIVAEAGGRYSGPLSLRVHIASPWWASAWFRAGCLLALLLLFARWRHTRIQQLRRRQMMQEQLHAMQLYQRRIDSLKSENDDLRNRHAEQITQAIVAQDEASQPKNAALSADDHLLMRVLQLINSRFKDPTLDVEWIAREACVSRSQLFRKIKSLTGQSPSELIRDVRLQRAALLLAGGGTSAKEVAYNCGFESASHFSRAFKARYGVSPTEYMQQHA